MDIHFRSMQPLFSNLAVLSSFAKSLKLSNIQFTIDSVLQDAEYYDYTISGDDERSLISTLAEIALSFPKILVQDQPAALYKPVGLWLRENYNVDLSKYSTPSCSGCSDCKCDSPDSSVSFSVMLPLLVFDLMLPDQLADFVQPIKCRGVSPQGGESVIGFSLLPGVDPSRVKIIIDAEHDKAVIYVVDHPTREGVPCRR